MDYKDLQMRRDDTRGARGLQKESAPRPGDGGAPPPRGM